MQIATRYSQSALLSARNVSSASVAESLEDAEACPHANPWYRAVYVDDEHVGFVMLSWDCVPRPPEIIGPWFLWKLLIDETPLAPRIRARGGAAGRRSR